MTLVSSCCQAADIPTDHEPSFEDMGFCPVCKDRCTWIDLEEETVFGGRKREMIKTVDELKEQATKENIHRWPLRECSICDVPLFYYIDGDNISFDSSCGCASSYPHARTWDDIAEAYNRNQPENNPRIQQSYLDKLNETWKFPVSEMSVGSIS